MSESRKRPLEDSEKKSKKAKVAAAVVPKTIQPSERKVIVLLDKAALETTKTKRGDFELLNVNYIILVSDILINDIVV